MKKSFSTLQKASGWTNIYETLMNEIGAEKTEKIFGEAIKISDKYMEKYKDRKGMNKVHVGGAIAVGSLYIPLKAELGKVRTFKLLDEGARPGSIAKHDKIEKLPKGMFIKVAGLITSKMFGEKAGFERRWISNTSKEKRFDLLTCPYVEVLTDMGCAEACPAICLQDEYSFSNMKNGVKFKRTKTLGNGDDCCDFWYDATE